MKYLFTFGTFALLLFNLQKVNGQVKIDTIYYPLDTAKVPVKDRMFRIETEGPVMGYILECKCYPYARGITYYFPIEYKKEKNSVLMNLGSLRQSQLLN